MTAIILAGGKASRMSGRDKAFLKIGRDILIKRQLRALKKIFKKIIIVTNTPQKYCGLKGITVVSDIVAGRGPLGGIYSGLGVSRDFYNFVIACDMPFIDARLIKYMDSLKGGFDVVVPRLRRGYETLFAIYSKNCLEHIKRFLGKDDLAVRQVFSRVKVREIGEAQIKRYGDPQVLFANINTPGQARRFSRLLREGRIFKKSDE